MFQASRINLVPLQQTHVLIPKKIDEVNSIFSFCKGFTLQELAVSTGIRFGNERKTTSTNAIHITFPENKSLVLIHSAYLPSSYDKVKYN